MYSMVLYYYDSIKLILFIVAVNTRRTRRTQLYREIRANVRLYNNILVSIRLLPRLIRDKIIKMP